jgi:hypothetical protein
MNVSLLRELGIGAGVAVGGAIVATKLGESDSKLHRLAVPLFGAGVLGGAVLAGTAIHGNVDKSIMAGLAVAMLGIGAGQLTAAFGHHDAHEGGRIMAPGPIGSGARGGDSQTISSHGGTPSYSDGVYRPGKGAVTYDDGVYHPDTHPGSIQLL